MTDDLLRKSREPQQELELLVSLISSARRAGSRLVSLALAILACWAGAASAENHRFKLTYGNELVCKAYVARLARTDFPESPYCRGNLAEAKGFEQLSGVALLPKEVGRLEPQVSKVLFDVDLKMTPSAPSDPALADKLYSAHPAAHNQQRAIDSGQLLKYYYRFEPAVDIDNDGVGDDLVVWKNSFAPCGALHDAKPDRGPTYFLILDSRKNVDSDRTQRIFSEDLSNAVALAHGRAVTIPANTAHPDALKLLGESFGVFRYQGTYYFDTYYSNSSNVGFSEPKKDRLGVFLRRGESTRLVCEIDVITIGSQ